MLLAPAELSLRCLLAEDPPAPSLLSLPAVLLSPKPALVPDKRPDPLALLRKILSGDPCFSPMASQSVLTFNTPQHVEIRETENVPWSKGRLCFGGVGGGYPHDAPDSLRSALSLPGFPISQQVDSQTSANHVESLACTRCFGIDDTNGEDGPAISVYDIPAPRTDATSKSVGSRVNLWRLLGTTLRLRGMLTVCWG
jgi:hypothetical protein